MNISELLSRINPSCTYREGLYYMSDDTQGDYGICFEPDARVEVLSHSIRRENGKWAVTDSSGVHIITETRNGDVVVEDAPVRYAVGAIIDGNWTADAYGTHETEEPTIEAARVLVESLRITMEPEGMEGAAIRDEWTGSIVWQEPANA